MDPLAPNLFVKDIRGTIEFYKTLGFNLVMSVPAEADGNLDWAMVSNGNVTFMFQTFQSLGDSLPMITRKDDATEFSITDPNNYVLTFAEEETA